MQPKGVGNGFDVVGRYLMDHIGGHVAHFEAGDIPKVSSLFGFCGLRHHGTVHVYLRGLALTRAAQARLEVTNASVYVSEERAPDDPWSALKRLMQLKSEDPVSDVLALASSCGLLVKGLGTRAFRSKYMPGSCVSSPSTRCCDTVPASSPGNSRPAVCLTSCPALSWRAWPSNRRIPTAALR